MIAIFSQPILHLSYPIRLLVSRFHHESQPALTGHLQRKQQ
ncbi:hypothetical protein HMPREF0650_1793 [Hoylesella buccalis ATCC 35310]|uniref:Uncharacterized protein n=1 Tax=Hoylesella buccalis ATCC 35310 TaxID=679190 RepID=D1W2H4_9BACT|nr:hypothetical protein HMPREF0650_1793 [Hoylesella buccalis ATCC 35310]